MISKLSWEHITAKILDLACGEPSHIWVFILETSWTEIQSLSSHLHARRTRPIMTLNRVSVAMMLSCSRPRIRVLRSFGNSPAHISTEVLSHTFMAKGREKVLSLQLALVPTQGVEVQSRTDAQH